MKQTIFYVTTNQGKFNEVSEYFKKHAAPFDLEMVSLEIPEIQTLDQHEIAMDKAQKAWDILKQPLIIDDAAVYFKRYKDFPGTLSKFVSVGMGLEGIKRLFDEGDEAFFRLTLVYVYGADKYHIIEAECHGHLTTKGTLVAPPGLPYDTYFVPNGSAVTNAHHATRDNPQFFYRIQAAEKFLAWFTHQQK